MMKFFKYILFFVVICHAVAVSAQNLPDAVVFLPDGSFKIGNAEFMIRGYSQTWAPVQNTWWTQREGAVSPSGFTIKADMRVSKVPAKVVQTIRPITTDQFSLAFKARFDKPVLVKALHGSLQLPLAEQTIKIDGVSYSIPEKYARRVLSLPKQVMRIELPISAGYQLVVTSPKKTAFLIQDNRKSSGKDMFDCRFATEPGRGEIQNAALDLTFELRKVKSQIVDLNGIANSSFRDDTAGDLKGGWTDQGAENDLRAIKSGLIHAGPVDFRILENEPNAIVLYGTGRRPGGTEIQIPLSSNTASAVNLLHASAWTPANGTVLGEIVAEFSDGTTGVVPVISQVDCGNWWKPFSVENAKIAWEGKNTKANLGLYVSSFQFAKSGLKKLTFKIKDSSGVWMIPAITLSQRKIDFAGKKQTIQITKPDDLWKPLTYNREVVTGSPFDFSFLHDAPAGKHGFVQVSGDGGLEFEKTPGKRVRFYGVNLCFSASYLNRDAIEELADYLVYCGYNCIRIHHHENDLLDKKASDSLTFDPVKLDKLDRLVAVMKEHGIYVTTDLYTSRTIKPGDNITGYPHANAKVVKALIPINSEAMDNWKAFARKWMNHRNPYTGLTWAQEPALWCVNMVNEDPLIRRYQYLRDEKTAAEYHNRFKQWLVDHHLPSSNPVVSNLTFVAFLNELQIKCLDEQKRFLKNELGLRTLLTSVNVDTDISLSLLRDRFEIVDNHTYFSHPNYLGKSFTPPIAIDQKSSIGQYAKVPRYVMSSRIAGKPYILTEFNFCSPNKYRSETGPLMGAYASLQNWDGLFRFAWAHGSRAIYSKLGAFGFDIAGDPLAQLSDRIAMKLFVEGNVKPSEMTYVYQVSPDNFHDNDNKYPEPFQMLGLITGIASGVTQQSGIPVTASEAMRPEKFLTGRYAQLWKFLQKDGIATSSTGQIKLDAKNGTLQVTTPQCICIVLPKGDMSAGPVRVSHADSYQTVALLTLDQKDLPESNSILLIHLTDISNTGLKYMKGKTMVLDPGDRPLLIREGGAVVSIVAENTFKVSALNADGRIVGTIPGKLQDNHFIFHINTNSFPGGVMGYHLTR
jgi:hypothetical protein